MKRLLIPMMMALPAAAGVKSGHAELSLLQGSEHYSAGKPMTMGIELKMDDGWHTYWVNPGEGGMAPRVTWTLPEGWVAGPVLYPVPKRFMTGELPGYGYEDAVVFPVFITPTSDAADEVEIAAKVSWLSCNDDACVPGSGEVSASLKPGVGEPGDSAAVIAVALKTVPEPLAGAEMKVTPGDGTLMLEVSLPAGVDATGSELFPATPATVDHSAPIRLEKSGELWRAEVATNAYAADRPEAFAAVLSGGGLDGPVLLKWPEEK